MSDNEFPEERATSSHSILGEEGEEEFKIYQAAISEEIEAAKIKAKLMLEQSNYTNTSQLVEENSEPEMKKKDSLNIDSLLRLFKSDFFESWIQISYLYRYTSPGVHDYLCNQLYNMPDSDIEFYIIDLCTMLVHNRFKSNALEKFLLDKCKQSVHFALLINWLFFSSTNGAPQIASNSESLQAKCEIAAVNGTLDQQQVSSLFEIDHCNERASDLREMQSNGTLLRYSPNVDSPQAIRDDSEVSPELAKGKMLRSESEPNLHNSQNSMDVITKEALEKLDRCDYFYQILHFVEGLGQISDKLRTVPVQYRQKALVREMKRVNENFHAGIYLPLWEADAPHYCILRLAADDVQVLKSRERVPFILLFEAVSCQENCSSNTVHKAAKYWYQKIQEMKNQAKQEENRENTEENNEENIISEEIKKEEKIEPEVKETKVEELKENNEKSNITVLKMNVAKPLPAADSEIESNYTKSPFGEPFAEKQERIRATSPYGSLAGWHIRSVIIKYGDDCKQEYLALQLINQFKKIFMEANLPLYVRPYRILVNSPDSGIIETITDAISVDGLKKFYSTERQVTLREHFLKYYVDPDSRAFKLAIRNFVESLAGYSLVCYLLQIKDRHNGNILIDSEGHLIHIDFGFMLTNSPGSINAENVPFKFTQEYLELMGGPQGSMYSYFKGLMRCGYLEVRKHYEKIISLVEIMSIDSTLPCFAAGQNAIEQLRERFNLTMTESQVDTFLENMIEQSYDSWRTRYYDRFQYMTNNILF